MKVYLSSLFLKIILNFHRVYCHLRPLCISFRCAARNPFWRLSFAGIAISANYGVIKSGLRGNSTQSLIDWARVMN